MSTSDDRRYTPAQLASVARWTAWPDPIRPPESDEEPWTPGDPSLPAPRTWSMFGLEDLAGWWAVVTAVVTAALLAVLLLLGLRAVRHPGGSR